MLGPKLDKQTVNFQPPSLGKEMQLFRRETLCSQACCLWINLYRQYIFASQALKHFIIDTPRVHILFEYLIFCCFQSLVPRYQTEISPMETVDPSVVLMP